MDLKGRLKGAAVEELRNLEVYMINMRSRWDGEIISFLYDQGIISDSDIDDAMRSAALKQARADYKLMTRKGLSYPIYADHCASPECLAYAIENNEFSDREIRRIPFDHGHTPEVFIREYRVENLPAYLREQLLHPRELTTVDFGDYDPHPVCECGH